MTPVWYTTLISTPSASLHIGHLWHLHWTLVLHINRYSEFVRLLSCCLLEGLSSVVQPYKPTMTFALCLSRERAPEVLKLKRKKTSISFSNLKLLFLFRTIITEQNDQLRLGTWSWMFWMIDLLFLTNSAVLAFSSSLSSSLWLHLLVFRISSSLPVWPRSVHVPLYTAHSFHSVTFLLLTFSFFCPFLCII